MRAPSIAAGDQAVMVVGAGSNTKGRDRSAKIALALALSLDDNTESARRHTGRCSAIHGHDVPSSFPRLCVRRRQPSEAPQSAILLWDSAAQRLDPRGRTYAWMAADSK